MKRRVSGLLLALCFLAAAPIPLAADWPQWRHDAQRSGKSPAALPTALHLRWVRQFPAPKPAWPASAELPFDLSYEPVVAGKTMFVPCNANDSVTALDTDSGQVKWRFYAPAPVRFAPVAWRDRLFFVADDGGLYCLNAADGALRWKFQGAPRDHLRLGNGRLISLWPARGGPVCRDGRIYFAAGLWPFMGVFVYALEAETGKLLWVNDSCGSLYRGTWNAKAFAGLSPQGYLTVKAANELADPSLGDVVVAPSGRSTPASFDRDTGELRFFGAFWSFRLNDKGERELYQPSKKGVYGGPFATSPNVEPEQPAHKLSIQAGRRTFAAGALPEIEGQATSLLAADGKLFVVTAAGKIYCFGGVEGKAATHSLKRAEIVSRDDAHKQTAEGILAGTGVAAGYCLVLGVGDGRLVEELVLGSDLAVVALDPDAAKVDTLRRKWDAVGWYGDRVHLLTGDLASLNLPPYLASLIVAAGLPDGTTLERLFACLRPYGGVACLTLSVKEHQALARRVAAARLPKASVRRDGVFSLLSRDGALPGADDWTHNFGKPGNTMATADDRVRGPLGPLWWGGPAVGKGNPPILVSAGRKFIMGRGTLTAVDIYTGRVLWETGSHGPRPQQFAAAEDALYLSSADKIMMVDPATGEIIAQISLRDADGNIGELFVWLDYLVAATPTKVVAMNRFDGAVLWQQAVGADIVPRLGRKYYSKSKYPGSSGIAVGGGKVFLIAGSDPAQRGAAKRRGETVAAAAALKAFDVRTGDLAWADDLPAAFMPWLLYSEDYDVLVQTQDYRTASQTGSEARETARRGADGKLLWRSKLDVRLTPPVVLTGRKLIAQNSIGVYASDDGHAYDLLTGDVLQRHDPLTDALTPWRYPKAGGCNYAVGSTHLLTYRSTTAAYYGLEHGGGGVTQLGAFRSACKNSLIVAGGLLNALGGGCSCRFPIRYTPVALVPMAEASAWTAYGPTMGEGRIRRLGVNLGAPGDRMSASGTLWLDHPSVGGPPPEIPVRLMPATARPVRSYPTAIRGGSLPWVSASAVEGVRSIAMPLVYERPGKSFSVRFQGKLTPEFTEDYTLHFRAYGGLRFWLGGELLVDSWRPFRASDRPRELVAPLTAGKSMDIKLEYFSDGRGRSDCLLQWSCASKPRPSALVGRLHTDDGEEGVVATYYEGLNLDGRSVVERAPGIGGRWWQSRELQGEPAALAKLPPRAELTREAAYTVRLYFAELQDAKPGERVFDVALQGQVVLEAFDIARIAGGPRRELVKEFKGIKGVGELVATLAPRAGEPLLSGIEIVQEDPPAKPETAGSAATALTGEQWAKRFETYRLPRRKPSPYMKPLTRRKRVADHVYIDIQAKPEAKKYAIDIPADGDYVIWAKVMAPDFRHDSFFVAFDDGAEAVYDVAIGADWHWDRVKGRGEMDDPGGVDPLVFRLKLGKRVLRFRERDPTGLQALIVTDDPAYRPRN